MLDNPRIRLHEAIAKNCKNIDSIIFIVEKILDSVKSWEEKRRARSSGHK
ncbi:hypothetical protein EC160873_02971 [Escherichia coli O145:H28]|nr:hypothetical protein EC160873_02971 [Escherichia coli O145:H28]